MRKLNEQDKITIWKCPECIRIVGFYNGRKDTCTHSWTNKGRDLDFKVLYEDK